LRHLTGAARTKLNEMLKTSRLHPPRWVSRKVVLTPGDLFWPTGTGRRLQVGEDILFDEDDKDEVAKEANLG
jgi:hypothetical protein